MEYVPVVIESCRDDMEPTALTPLKPLASPNSALSSAAVHILNASSAAADTVAAVATAVASAPSSASGNSSATVIQIIHPAAKPMPSGSRDAKVSTNMNAGTANAGWGNEVTIAHPAHFHGDTPLAAKTVATAIPSGMLCAPIARVTNVPCVHPRSPPKLTPTPDPSPNECAVIMLTISSVFRASAPRSNPNLTSSWSRSNLCVTAMNTAPKHTPNTTSNAPCGSPSCTRSKDAASITPHASAFAKAASLGESRRTKKNGSAPRPLAAAMSRVMKNTAPTVGTPAPGAAAIPSWVLSSTGASMVSGLYNGLSVDIGQSPNRAELEVPIIPE